MQSWRSRTLFLTVVAVGYVLFAALRTRDGTGPAWIAMAVLPVLLALAWMWSAPPDRGIDPVEGAVRKAARVAALGAALLVASWTGVTGTASLVVAANLGTALASIASLVALARIAAMPGLLQPPPATRRLDAVALAALMWGIALALPLARVLVPERTTMLDPVAINYATTAAATGSMGLIVAAALRVRALRRLELGVADRAAAALALSVVALAVSAPAALLRVAPPDQLMSVAAVLASFAVLFSCITYEPTSVARTMRTILALVLLGAPVALAGVALSLRFPQSTGLTMMSVGAAALVIGLAAPALARPFGPAGSRWLEAIQKANDAALHPDPDVALREALTTVRTVLPSDSASPVLFRASPAEALTVDRAGYLHTQDGEAPPELYELAEGEPERTIRVEAMRSLEVRRADLRPLVAWMDGRGLMAVTAVRDDEQPVGLLGLPRGKRRTPMNLEEVKGLRVLADRIGAVLGVSSALARSRAREMELRRLADRRGDEIDRLQHKLTVVAGREQVVTERLAAPLRATTYSAAAMSAHEQVLRAGSAGQPLVLHTPAGVDPVPWAAAAHLASGRKERVFLAIDGTDTGEHDLERWRDPDSSPLALANGGTLFVMDGPSLPRTVQDFIAASLAERVSPGGGAAPLDVCLSVSLHQPMTELVASGRLGSALAQWLGDAVVPLPPLSQRVEDLRALVLERLVRLGVRWRGEPMGIDDAALGRLMEHDWPGNDHELTDVLLRAVLVAKGKRVLAADLDAIGFGRPELQPGRSKPAMGPSPN